MCVAVDLLAHYRSIRMKVFGMRKCSSRSLPYLLVPHVNVWVEEKKSVHDVRGDRCHHILACFSS